MSLTFPQSCRSFVSDTDEEGQGLAEYALILALIAIVAIVALIFLGGQCPDDPLDRRQLRLGARLATLAGCRI